MKTNSRKKLLVSSIAMLMVSTVALGSATFAWFSQNTKATASGITAKTTQSSNIVLSENKQDWTDTLIFTKNTAVITGSVTPVTTADFNNWYKTLASGKDTGIKGADNEYATAAAGTDYLQTKLYVKYEATEGTKNVDLKLKTNVEEGVEDFLRVALVPTGTKLVQDNIVFGTADDDFAKSKDEFTALDKDNGELSLVTITSKDLIDNVALTAGTEYEFDVYVWYEGTDPHCIDSKSVNDVDISFEFTEHTANTGV